MASQSSASYRSLTVCVWGWGFGGRLKVIHLQSATTVNKVAWNILIKGIQVSSLYLVNQLLNLVNGVNIGYSFALEFPCWAQHGNSKAKFINFSMALFSTNKQSTTSGLEKRNPGSLHQSLAVK